MYPNSFVAVLSVGILLCVDVMAKSSAYDIMLTLAGLGRVSCMQMLNRVGGRMRPCATPFGKLIVCDDLPLNDTCGYLPPM